MKETKKKKLMKRADRTRNSKIGASRRHTAEYFERLEMQMLDRGWCYDRIVCGLNSNIDIAVSMILNPLSSSEDKEWAVGFIEFGFDYIESLGDTEVADWSKKHLAKRTARKPTIKSNCQ